MVDNRKIAEKLRIIKENLTKLTELRDVPIELFIEDFQKHDSAKYNLQTAIEAMLDICNHVIARRMYQVPKTNAEAFRILCRKRLLHPDMEGIYMAMARFRNRVVHMYDEVDNCEVYRMICDHLPDFQIFVDDITDMIHNR